MNNHCWSIVPNYKPIEPYCTPLYGPPVGRTDQSAHITTTATLQHAHSSSVQNNFVGIQAVIDAPRQVKGLEIKSNFQKQMRHGGPMHHLN